jgi:hypothetical protein
MECYKVDYNDNLERINARSSRSDRAMALVGAVDAVLDLYETFQESGVFIFRLT